MNEDQLDEQMLSELQRRVRELPREIAPPEGAWNRIARQIESERVVSSPIARSLWQRPAFLAAAAVFLVAVTSVTTSVVVTRRMDNGLRETAATPGDAARKAVMSGAVASAPGTLAEFTARENDYIATVNALSNTIESEHVELAPGTIMKLKESVRIIDEAILEARRALARDPSNKALMEMLSTSYDQKVDLLRRTAEMGQS
jgi:hypothetical protein